MYNGLISRVEDLRIKRTSHARSICGCPDHPTEDFPVLSRPPARQSSPQLTSGGPHSRRRPLHPTTAVGDFTAFQNAGNRAQTGAARHRARRSRNSSASGGRRWWYGGRRTGHLTRRPGTRARDVTFLPHRRARVLPKSHSRLFPCPPLAFDMLTNARDALRSTRSLL